jgi:hypothetical protein
MKFFGCLLKILAALILFIFIGIFTIFITPYLTAENYEYDDTPNGSFRVIVASIDDGDNEPILGSISINELSELEENVDYKIYRSKSDGQCSNISFWCQATITGPQKQLIELKYSQENYQLYNKYYVVDGKIEPIYFRIMDRGDAIMGFLISIVFTPVVLLLLRFSVKKLKRSQKSV